MGNSQGAGTAGLLQDGQDSTIRLRAVVATYRAALQCYTLAVTPAELIALGAMSNEAAAARDPRAHAHLARLRDDVHGSGIALPGAIIAAVSGGRLRCECDHLYTLELRPHRGDRLFVMDGHERLLALAHGERRHCKTLVSMVLWRTALESAAATPDAAVDGVDNGARAHSAAARWANAARLWH